MELENTRDEAAARALHILPNASDFTIDGGNFTNVNGGMHVHHHPTPPTPGDPAPERVCSESQLYTKNLIAFGRGYPLLIAQPRMNLPLEYRSRGVSIGDVGRVSPQGDFDFFFNVYRARDHPINHNRVPEDFSPLEELDESDLFWWHIKRGSLSSTTVQSHCPDLNARSQYRTPFCLPRAQWGVSGASGRLDAVQARDVEAMRRYAAANAESWYRYVNEKRGRRLGNGRLYLITGWEKAPMGGMATFQNVAPARDFDIALVPLKQPGGGVEYAFSRGDPARAYTFATSPPTADGAPNHAVFLQGFSISLGQGIIQRLLGRRVMFSHIGDKLDSSDADEYIPFSDTQGSFLSFTFSFFGGYGSGGGNQASASATETRLADLAPSADVLHPSRLINEHLVRTVPDASVIITHDDDWVNALRENPDALRDPEFVQKVLDGRKIENEHGVVFLHRHGTDDSRASSAANELLSPLFAYPEPRTSSDDLSTLLSRRRAAEALPLEATRGDSDNFLELLYRTSPHPDADVAFEPAFDSPGDLPRTHIARQLDESGASEVTPESPDHLLTETSQAHVQDRSEKPAGKMGKARKRQGQKVLEDVSSHSATTLADMQDAMHGKFTKTADSESRGFACETCTRRGIGHLCIFEGSSKSCQSCRRRKVKCVYSAKPQTHLPVHGFESSSSTDPASYLVESVMILSG
ncbi:Pleiotropic drug resistance ABC transporter protein [Mycena kentingensis (nom. inval.)]|nr:Pleiotropic drug resistance ABC transporter protein [Mycena kentingensis (nom. inval.)]